MACSPAPLAVPIGNVSLSNGWVMRGIEIGVGNPVQPFAFIPQWPENNTYLYDTNTPCVAIPPEACITYRGGQYHQLASESSETTASSAAAGGSSDSVDDGSTWITDDLVLNSNFTESSFPLGIFQTDPGTADGPTLMELGLGGNSTILNLLRSTGKIASRTWSMFWGLTGATPDQQTNGTFVFGGYDASKIAGDNHTKALTLDNPACANGMMVTLSDIQMQFPNGSTYSLYGGSHSTAINACINPSAPYLMTLPYAYYQVFEKLCGCSSSDRSFNIDFYTMLYDVNGPLYQGDLVLEIDSTIKITIPNSQLLTPEVTILDSGELSANYSTDDLRINSIQDINENDLPYLGRAFLSTAMVMVNLDTNMFTLWQASANDDQALVPVDTNGLSQSICSAAEIPSATNSASPASSSTENTGKTALSAGAIAGIAIGSVAVLAMAGIVAFFVFRRRRQNRAQATPELYSVPQAPTTQWYQKKETTSPAPNNGVHESGAQLQAAELAAGRH